MEKNSQFLEIEQGRASLLASEYYDIAQLETQAWQLINAHNQVEHDHWSAEPQINARTALFEELTARGHLSRVEYDCDVEKANRQTLLRLLNGWWDNLPEYEKVRRFGEIVEELIVQSVWVDIKSGNLPSDTMVLTHSDYEENAPPKEAHLMGYRYLNRKGYVRGTHFEQAADGQWRRVVEQISRSNSNDQSSSRFIQEWGSYTADVSGGTQRLRHQMLISRRDFPGGVVDVVRELDTYAGSNIYYGEDITNVWPPLPDYDELRAVSYQREKQVESFTDRLAAFERQLNIRYHAGQVTYEQKLSYLYEERTKLVNEICLLDPRYAHDARGELSGKYFERAAAAMAAGNHSAGQQYLENALRSVDPRAAAVCGGTGMDSNRRGLSTEGKQIYANALEERKYWKWQKGYCVVDKCKNKNKRVEVGPCSVCRNCQAVFDGQKTKPQFDLFDILAAGFARAATEIRLSKWLAKKEIVQTKAEKKQLELLIHQEILEIKRLKKVA